MYAIHINTNNNEPGGLAGGRAVLPPVRRAVRDPGAPYYYSNIYMYKYI